jgi:hypothetical protein
MLSQTQAERFMHIHRKMPPCRERLYRRKGTQLAMQSFRIWLIHSQQGSQKRWIKPVGHSCRQQCPPDRLPLLQRQLVMDQINSGQNKQSRLSFGGLQQVQSLGEIHGD